MDLTFAGSTVGEPWWTCGEIVAAALAPRGYQVTVTDESYSERNISWVSQGRAQVGVTTPRHFAAALARKGVHANSDTTRLRALATISRPNWLALAVRAELGISGLAEVREKQMPVRILAGGAERGGELAAVLGHYGFTVEDLLSWGGAHHRWSGRMKGSYVRDGVVDVMLGNIYAGYTPHNRFWYEATCLYDMRFCDFDEGLITLFTEQFGYTRGVIPHGLFPGVDRDIPSVQQDTMIVYCRDDLPDSVVRDVAEALDENSDLFMLARSPLYYERHKVGRIRFIPLHPVAAQVYRDRGYPVESPAAPNQ